MKITCPLVELTFLKGSLVAILSSAMLKDPTNLGTVAFETKVAFTNLALPPNPHHYRTLALIAADMASFFCIPD